MKRKASSVAINSHKRMATRSQRTVMPSEDSSKSARSGSETHIDELPIEMLRHILGYLKLPEQLKLATVSRRWRQAVDECRVSCRHLSREFLSRHGIIYVRNGMLEKILPRFPGLHKIDMSISTEREFDIMCRHCPQLREVALCSFRADVPSLERLCSCCPNLEKVTLLYSCDDACVEAVLRGLPQLRSLSIDLENITGQCLSLLPSGLQCLKLRGDWNRRLCPAELDRAARCPALKELVLSCRRKPSHDFTKLLDICPQLERLSASESYLSDAFLKQLPGKTPSIRELDLDNCRNVTAAGYKAVGRLKELRTLTLDCMITTDEVLEKLQGAPHLRRLTVTLAHYGTKRCSKEAVARLVLSCPSLSRVYLPPNVSAMAVFRRLKGRLSADRDVTLMLDTRAIMYLEDKDVELPFDGEQLRVGEYSIEFGHDVDE